jgi:heme exporter protein D
MFIYFSSVDKSKQKLKEIQEKQQKEQQLTKKKITSGGLKDRLLKKKKT